MPETAPRNCCYDLFCFTILSIRHSDSAVIKIKLHDIRSILYMTFNFLCHTKPQLSITILFRIIKGGMSRLLPVSLMSKTGTQRILKAYIRKLIKPVYSKLIQFIRKHLTIVGEHIHPGYLISQFPCDPVTKLFRLRLVTIASGSGNRRKHLNLNLRFHLPYIRLQRMTDFSFSYYNPAVTVKPLPFFLRHKTEQIFVHFWPSDIEKMTSANIKRTSIHLTGSAKSSCFCFLLHYQKRIFT